MSKPVKRAYDSSRRKEQARETQRRILRAASELFIAKGYGQTTITDIARAADVSPETIYATFKTKANVLHRVWDITVGGDDEDVKYHERPEIQAIRAEPDLATRLRMQAPFSTKTARRMAPFTRALQGAAATEPAAADMLAEMARQRYEGLGVMAAEAARTGQLKVSEQECRDVMWATTDGLLWHHLVAERGWTDERYAEWLGEMWVNALVGEKRRPRPGQGRG